MFISADVQCGFGYVCNDFDGRCYPDSVCKYCEQHEILPLQILAMSAQITHCADGGDEYYCYGKVIMAWLLCACIVYKYTTPFVQMFNVNMDICVGMDCIPSQFRCDNRTDCADGDDEDGCNGKVQ